MQIQSFTIPDPRIAVANLHRDFRELAITAQSWDHTFETATGTYPTHEFVANFRGFGDRLEHARKRAKGYGLSELGNMALLRLRLPVSATSTLKYMADERVTFKPTMVGGAAWSSMLDQLVTDLVRGERLLYARLLTMEPTQPKVPNTGPGGPRQPHPGTGPRPTPIP